MSPLNFTHILAQTVDKLSESESYKGLFHQHTDGNPLPSGKVLQQIVELTRAIIFPGYFGISNVNSRTLKYHIGIYIEQLFEQLTEQILAGLCFAGDGQEDGYYTEQLRQQAAEKAAGFIATLPEMRHILATDVEAAYNGDRDLFTEALVNLIVNGVKASEPGSAVRLYTEDGGIVVEDSGRGIPENEIARITEPFYMVDKSRSRKSGGAGLGLALTTVILRRHSMAMRIESALGKGTKITIFTILSSPETYHSI